MKIGFLGLCDFGFQYLNYLLNDEAEISFVTSKGSSLPHIQELESKCGVLCQNHNIPYLGNVDVNTPEMIDRISKTDVCILGGYDKIIKRPFIDSVKSGVFNTHLGLIPRHRGCYPLIWSILCDDVAGFSTYKLTPEIDFGPIVYQTETKIKPDEGIKHLYGRLSKMVVEAFPDTWKKIKTGDWIELKSKEQDTPYHKVGMPNDRWISWKWTCELLSRFSRALDFPPYPGPRTRLNSGGKEISLTIQKWERKKQASAPGSILKIKDNEIIVACRDGFCYCRLTGDVDQNEIRKGATFDSVEGEKHPIVIDYSNDRLVLN